MVCGFFTLLNVMIDEACSFSDAIYLHRIRPYPSTSCEIAAQVGRPL